MERMEGVVEGRFSYEASEGVVTYDPAVTTGTEIAAELARLTGYTASIRENGGAGR